MNFNPLTLDGKLKEMYDFWLALHPAPGHLPKRGQVTMANLKPFLPYISLIERRPPDNDYYYRLQGSGFIRPQIGDSTGKRLKDTLPDCLLHSLLKGLDQVAGNCKPYLDRAFYVDEDGFEEIFTRIILPLADNGQNPDIFLLYGHPES